MSILTDCARRRATCKQFEVGAKIRAALAAAGHKDVAINWNDSGDGVRVKLAEPTPGLPRWRLQIDGHGGDRFHEKKDRGFNYQDIAIKIVAVVAREKNDAKLARLVKSVEREAKHLNKELRLDSYNACAMESYGTLRLNIDLAVTADQVRVVIAAARACGLLPEVS